MLIVAAIGRRRAWQPEPLGVVFCLVFLAIGVRAAVRAWTGSVAVATPALVGVDWLAAAAAGAFLSLHARDGGFIDKAGGGRHYPEKGREARGPPPGNAEPRGPRGVKAGFPAMG